MLWVQSDVKEPGMKVMMDGEGNQARNWSILTMPPKLVEPSVGCWLWSIWSRYAGKIISHKTSSSMDS
jgi:hypothetical protein